MPQIKVTFDVDSNGVLKVTAKDSTTGKEQTIRIEANSGLTEADIERMKQDAEANAGEDAKKKEVIESRNLAEQMIYTAEKALQDHKDKVSSDIKQAVEDKIRALRDVKDKDDKTVIQEATQALSAEMQKIGESMQPPAGDKTPGEQNSSNNDTVRDADVADDDNERKG